MSSAIFTENAEMPGCFDAYLAMACPLSEGEDAGVCIEYADDIDQIFVGGWNGMMDVRRDDVVGRWFDRDDFNDLLRLLRGAASAKGWS
jgi:hypothetical protein